MLTMPRSGLVTPEESSGWLKTTTLLPLFQTTDAGLDLSTKGQAQCCFAARGFKSYANITAFYEESSFSTHHYRQPTSNKSISRLHNLKTKITDINIRGIYKRLSARSSSSKTLDLLQHWRSLLQLSDLLVQLQAIVPRVSSLKHRRGWLKVDD